MDKASQPIAHFVTDMPNPPKRPAPVSWRLAPEKRLRLDAAADAAGMSRNAYIEWRVFDPAIPAPRRRGGSPTRDHKAMSQAIALLSQSHIPNNLNQLARAANSGSLVLTPEIEAELLESLRHIKEIRRLLIAALNLSDGEP